MSYTQAYAEYRVEHSQCDHMHLTSEEARKCATEIINKTRKERPFKRNIKIRVVDTRRSSMLWGDSGFYLASRIKLLLWVQITYLLLFFGEDQCEKFLINRNKKIKAKKSLKN